MSLTDAIDALGIAEPMGTRQDEVALDAVVGSVAREVDYGPRFEPRRRDDRWERQRRLLEQGRQPDPIDLVQLGELYFITDGHHRVSVALHAGWTTLPARITRYCTVAYAMCCLRHADLDSKSAERRFLERVPLPDEIRRHLWLERPADWARLADHARAWAHEQHVAGDAHDLASAWWEHEVIPVLTHLRNAGAGTGLRDVELYVTALATRDRLGALEWPDTFLHECCTRPDPSSCESV